MGTLVTKPLLKGIARMAAASPRLRQRAEVEFFGLECRSALNRESSGRLPFAWTLNPYRGCEFGCHYCYARYTHEFMEMRDGEDFERKIFAKVNAPELLREELRTARDRSLPIALGTATDPYQPAEICYRITRRMLEVCDQFEGLELSITTKSTLILRDLDLLVGLGRKHRLSVRMTVTTLDERLARLLEPKAPPPAKRMEAVEELARAGVYVGVNLMPIIPGITDAPQAMEAVARQASDAGARFLAGQLLFLMPSAMRRFMPFLKREFPALAAKYRRAYSRSAYLSGEYKQRIERRVGDLRRRYGLEARREEGHNARGTRQLALAFQQVQARETNRGKFHRC